MKADTFAKLVVLETLVEAEIGHHLENRSGSADAFRESLVARISDLVDEIDLLDARAAAGVYDAVVEFLAGLAQEHDAIIAASFRFKTATARIVERGMGRIDLEQPSTWAVVLCELLDELAAEYGAADPQQREPASCEQLRAQQLLARARETADRMLWYARVDRATELSREMERLTFAVRHQRLPAAEVERLARGVERLAQQYRPSSLRRVGGFVLRQLLGRSDRGAVTGPEPR